MKVTKAEQWRITAGKLQELLLEVERLKVLYRDSNDVPNTEMLTNFVQKPLREVRDTLNAL